MSNTLFIGKVYYSFDELSSTNDFARELLAKSRPPEGTVVRAVTQTAGRGQFGSRWLSEPGANLTLSVILYPGWLKVSDQFRLSEAVALAVRDTAGSAAFRPSRSRPFRASDISGGENTALKGRGQGGLKAALPAPAIKWPNDIYLGERKTAGILIQNTLAGDRLETAVVGIGLNVNQQIFPPEASNATSMALFAGRTFDLDAVAQILFENLERRYLQLKSGQTGILRAEYRQHLYGLDEEKQFARPDGHVFRGIIRGVQPDGQLMIQTENGLEFFSVKSIQMLHV
ncbi:MAG: biotin--[acetyl-CoA-carboxylase] ligase [Thermoanaerobaculia bacterium]|nr:biotin--[acetyl-CoA-carboxylase] ligase [Thermoanaerobaculia bacterium]